MNVKNRKISLETTKFFLSCASSQVKSISLYQLHIHRSVRGYISSPPKSNPLANRHLQESKVSSYSAFSVVSLNDTIKQIQNNGRINA
jgi:hypothetical protein